jgi:predicted DNA-binding transcriptional regulator AlpA
MPQLTLSAVAKMYGMHRTTLYAAIKAGRVSSDVNRRGQKVIELSEAIRAWGEPEGRPGHEFDSSTQVNTGVSTHSTAPVEYMTEATAIRLATAMERLIEIEEAKLLLLEHKPDVPPMGVETHLEDVPAASLGKVASEPRSFADLLAGLD